MAYLFIDSTEELVCGLISDDFKWLEYETFKKVKASSVLHFEAFKFLEKRNLKLNEIQAVFSVAGPGSYTGMRLGEGFVQALNYLGLPVFSFYHFEVPRMCGVERGYWLAKAFKQEIFVHEWDMEKSEQKLVPESRLLSLFAESKLEGFSLIEPIQDLGNHSTRVLISQNPEKIFPRILETNLRREPFYFRTLEQDFTPLQK